MVYSQPKSFVRWLSHVLAAVFLSMFVGSVFWDIPASDPQLIFNDRLAYLNAYSLPILYGHLMETDNIVHFKVEHFRN